MGKLAVIGTGYVGLVTGACFAELGNHVACVDSDNTKIRMLKGGEIPFFEPGLSEVVRRNVAAGRLTFHETIGEGIRGTEFVFIAVGTPTGPDGRADLRSVRAVAREIATSLDSEKIVVNKSTVPVETGDLVEAIIRENNPTSFEIGVVSNPEFLREGSAIEDFMHPDRIVIGASNPEHAAAVSKLYAPLDAPIIVTDVRTAEMIKYTANAFLAAKISFINEIANICERTGADVKDVAHGIGSDKRIGSLFLNAGLGFGGSCFPKDVTALTRMAEANGVHPLLLNSVLDVNEAQIRRVTDRLDNTLGDLHTRCIAVLGLSYKPNTDDVRDSPAIKLIRALIAEGARVRVHDPAAMATSRAELDDEVAYAATPYEAADGTDAVVVATDWNEYKQLDLAELADRMRGDLLIDARNIYDPEKAVAAGLSYAGIGRVARTNTIQGSPA
jgi:UDPglucose 6-dehydrogenase